VNERDAAIDRIARLLYEGIIPESKRQQSTERAAWREFPWLGAAENALTELVNDKDAMAALTPEPPTQG